MAITSFIPEVWNAQLQTDFSEQVVAVALANREYEGNASSGNTVRINTAGAITVKDYKTGVSGQGARTTAPDAVDTTSEDLVINQEKSFDFYVDDIDRAQAAGTMDAFTRNAGEGLAQDADTYLLNLLAASVHADNVLDGTAPTTGDAAYTIILNMRKALNLKKVPKAQRVLFVNSEFEALLLGADSKLTSVDKSGSPAGLREATIGRILGFDVVTTDNLPETDAPQAVAVYTPLMAYVSQIEKTEAMRAQDKFADRLRGLHVYGAKVLRGGIGVARFTATA